MNDINEMPPKCQYCPYWEVCEYPWVYQDREQPKANLQQTCYATDTISRQAAKLKVARVIWEDGDSCYDFHDKCIDCLDDLPSAQPEIKPIDYQDCANAMMKMWMDNVLTDGEYNRIMDKLNKHEMERRKADERSDL